MELSALINNYMPSLTKTEKKVAEYVLNNMEKILYMSMIEVSDAVSVSETTVLRFCRKIGFSGYQEFRIELAKNQSSSPQINDSENYIINYLTNVMNDTISSLNKEKIGEAAEIVFNAKFIYIYGVGSSGITALDMENRLIRMGLKAQAVIDWHIQTIISANATGNDVIIAISVSGSTNDVINTINVAKDNGAKIISITNFFKSSIGNLADISLVVSAKESPIEGGYFGSKIAQLMCISILCNTIEENNKDYIFKKREKIAKELSKQIC